MLGLSWVSPPRFHSVNTILENWPYALYAVAYATSLAAFVMTNMVWLRVWVIVSSTAYATYYFVFPAEPMWLDVITEALLVAVNITMLALVASSALTIRFDDSEQFLYDTEFSSLGKVDFRKILRAGEWHSVAPGFEFTHAGQPVGYPGWRRPGGAAGAGAAGASRCRAARRCALEPAPTGSRSPSAS